jgi:hypothetical protein
LSTSLDDCLAVVADLRRRVAEKSWAPHSIDEVLAALDGRLRQLAPERFACPVCGNLACPHLRAVAASAAANAARRARA